MTQVNASMVKQLRERTGAGMMDCKKALVESGGNEDAAAQIIQKKGLAKAAKKAGAIATEGVVHSYIHAGSRVGVLVEVNCQTDFVARSDDFKGLVDAIGLQIASMSPEFVKREYIPQARIEEQQALFSAQIKEEDAKSGKSRPEQAVAKIIEGKTNKWMTEACLLDQVSVLDGDKTFARIVEELTAKLGEKIDVRRFTRYELGEGLEKKTTDLAAEVAETLAN